MFRRLGEHLMVRPSGCHWSLPAKLHEQRHRAAKLSQECRDAARAIGRRDSLADSAVQRLMKANEGLLRLTNPNGLSSPFSLIGSNAEVQLGRTIGVQSSLSEATVLWYSSSLLSCHLVPVDPAPPRYLS